MPSIRNSLLLIGALLSVTSIASPVPEIQVRSGGPGSNSSPGGPSDGNGCTVITTTRTVVGTSTLTPTSTATSVVVSTPTIGAKLPTTGGTTELPATANSVKFVAIGRGIQNYTCSAVNATPVALGAIAVLFDYTYLASLNETELNTLPGRAVNVAFNPFPLDGARPSLAGLPPAKTLGHHFFAADGSPTFNLTGAPIAYGENMVLFGNKTATVAAPAGSPLGPDGTGAVAWLQLEAKINIAAETSVGIKEAYRVETAGGNPEPLCSSVGVMSIPYASEYWFFD